MLVAGDGGGAGARGWRLRRLSAYHTQALADMLLRLDATRARAVISSESESLAARSCSCMDLFRLSAASLST